MFKRIQHARFVYINNFVKQLRYRVPNLHDMFCAVFALAGIPGTRLSAIYRVGFAP